MVTLYNLYADNNVEVTGKFDHAKPTAIQCYPIWKRRCNFSQLR